MSVWADPLGGTEDLIALCELADRFGVLVLAELPKDEPKELPR